MSHNITISKYQKTAVKKALVENLLAGKLEESSHWTTELVCSGFFADLWDTFLYFFAKHVHLGNPKLPLYLELRFTTFRQCALEERDELNLRMNDTVRRLFSEIVCVLCTSTKKHSVEPLKVKEEFNLAQLQDKLKAPTVDFLKPFFKEGDPTELFIPYNELAYALDAKNSLLACHWLEWIQAFERACGKKKIRCTCANRDYVVTKYSNDVIWIFWDIVTASADPRLKKILMAAAHLFCIKYVPACKERRKLLMYFAIALRCEPVDLTIDMIAKKHIIEGVYAKCAVFYTKKLAEPKQIA
jgi:hypothetical protein